LRELSLVLLTELTSRSSPMLFPSQTVSKNRR
jgi:hypothetical protein